VQEKLPEDQTVYFERGLAYQMMGNHELAIRDFTSAIDIDNKYAEALLSIGESQLGIKDVYAAKSSFEKARSTDDGSRVADIDAGLGRCYHMQQEYENALELFEDAIKEDPDNVSFRRARSSCYYD
jgi:tetratricopeptide (TPR) repeat protein